MNKMSTMPLQLATFTYIPCNLWVWASAMFRHLMFVLMNGVWQNIIEQDSMDHGALTAKTTVYWDCLTLLQPDWYPNCKADISEGFYFIIVTLQ